MSNLSADQLSELKQMLDKRFAVLTAELQREVDEQDDFLDVATEAPDPGDSSFANLAVDLGNAAITRDIVELRAIEAARKRMENGTYGDCVRCETEIPYERLKVQPTAERCAPCQEAHEKTHAEGGRGATL
ncbi:TraR/DksA family transcriptional regulator [Herbaspirillum sp. HC18]|nr:TraR/DksA family transcriptional regulator [Herbaspirillum sp. HC18]